jgi:hypothetical protein
MRVGPGERVGAPAAGVGAQFDDGVRGQLRTGPLGVTGLTAPCLTGRNLRRGGFDLRAVGRRGLGRVGRVLVEPGLQLDDALFQLDHPGRLGLQPADVRLHGRGQRVEHIRG